MHNEKNDGDDDDDDDDGEEGKNEELYFIQITHLDLT